MYSREQLRRAMRLYAVTDRTWLHGRTLPACVACAIAGGASFVQLREKSASSGEKAALARAISPLCRAAGAPFVIDDDVDVALAVSADGVHVGQSDVACAEARAALGPGKIVGVSAQTVAQALAAQQAGADSLGVGAVFGTPTTPDAELVSLATLADICAAVDIPVVAIGGLNERTLDSLAKTGVAGAAVVSALFSAPDIEQAARRLRAQIDAVLE